MSRSEATPLWRRLAAEALGTGLLTAVVVGSGIAASRLSPTDVGLQLLENALATAAALYVLILVLGPVSGAQFNPVVTGVAVFRGDIRLPAAVAYAVTQIVAAVAGAVLANLMFAEATISISTTDRLSPATFLAEVVATAGLIIVIFSLAATGRAVATAVAVAAYIGAAYFFTSSTSFANPAVTIGRIASDSFAGIAPGSALGYIGAQLLGAILGAAVVALLFGRLRQASPR